MGGGRLHRLFGSKRAGNSTADVYSEGAKGMGLAMPYEQGRLLASQKRPSTPRSNRRNLDAMSERRQAGRWL